MSCRRCRVTRCAAHTLADDQRCDRCERDWVAEAPTRRAIKLIFVPALSILVGGALFAVLLPTLGGAAGAAIICTLAFAATLAVGAGACQLVDRGSRVLFLRERPDGLPTARLLPSPRR